MAYTREYYLKNKERWDAYGNKWRAANPEKIKAIQARSRAKNRKVCSAHNKRYYSELKGTLNAIKLAS